MWLNDIADPLHFGYWGGLITKIIWFVFGLGISSLTLSGIWTILKRKALNKRKESSKTLGVWKYINLVIYAVMMYFMYTKLIVQYRTSTIGVILISIGWLVCIGLAYYIFVYLLNKAVKEDA